MHENVQITPRNNACHRSLFTAWTRDFFISRCLRVCTFETGAHALRVCLPAKFRGTGVVCTYFRVGAAGLPHPRRSYIHHRCAIVIVYFPANVHGHRPHPHSLPPHLGASDSTGVIVSGKFPPPATYKSAFVAATAWLVRSSYDP